MAKFIAGKAKSVFITRTLCRRRRARFAANVALAAASSARVSKAPIGTAKPA